MKHTLFLFYIFIGSLLLPVSSCTKANVYKDANIDTQFPLHIIDKNGNEVVTSGKDLYIYAKDDTMAEAVPVFDGEQDSVYELKSVSDDRGYSYHPGEGTYPPVRVVGRGLQGQYVLAVPVLYSYSKELTPLHNNMSGIHTIYINIPSKAITIRADFYWQGSNTNFYVDKVYMNKVLFMSINNSNAKIYDTSLQCYTYQLQQ